MAFYFCCLYKLHPRGIICLFLFIHHQASLFTVFHCYYYCTYVTSVHSKLLHKLVLQVLMGEEVNPSHLSASEPQPPLPSVSCIWVIFLSVVNIRPCSVVCLQPSQSRLTKTLRRRGQNTSPDPLGLPSATYPTWAREENKLITEFNNLKGFFCWNSQSCRVNFILQIYGCDVWLVEVLVAPLSVPLCSAPRVHDSHQLHLGAVIIDLKMKPSVGEWASTELSQMSNLLLIWTILLFTFVTAVTE